MQSDLPKQFMLLAGKPVLMHTLQQFYAADQGISIILVLPSQQVDHWKLLCQKFGFNLPHQIVNGGVTRYDSVKNGLRACPEDGIVAIHDGVRPLVSSSIITNGFETASSYGSALPVLPITQSLRKVSNGYSEPISRENIVAVQTPQCFSLIMLKPCYKKPFDKSFTDDATVFESDGHKVHLIEGDSKNIKITNPADLKIAEAILGSSVV